MALVMLMEDNVQLSFAIREAFEAAGHDVESSVTAHEALAIMEQRRVDLVIADIYIYNYGQIVEDGGIRLIGAMRLQRETSDLAYLRDLPVIAISGAPDRPGDQRILDVAKSAGADYLLSKPFEPEQLVRMVERVLRAAET